MCVFSAHVRVLCMDFISRRCRCRRLSHNHRPNDKISAAPNVSTITKNVNCVFLLNSREKTPTEHVAEMLRRNASKLHSKIGAKSVRKIHTYSQTRVCAKLGHLQEMCSNVDDLVHSTHKHTNRTHQTRTALFDE